MIVVKGLFSETDLDSLFSVAKLVTCRLLEAASVYLRTYSIVIPSINNVLLLFYQFHSLISNVHLTIQGRWQTL